MYHNSNKNHSSNRKRHLNVQYGDIWYVDKTDEDDNGSVQSGIRPAVIISNNKNNQFAPSYNVILLTHAKKKNLPVHIRIGDSTALCEQITTISETKMLHFVRSCSNKEMQRLNEGIKIQLNMM